MNEPRRAALYARVSSDKQKEEHTIASQTSALRAYAAEQGYEVLAPWVFEDEGYSGKVLSRPGLERLRDLAAEGLISHILIYAPDRLSRKYAYQVLLLEEFGRHGVDVIFLKSVRGETPEEQLLLQFQGMIAEYERAQIAERSRRGKRHRARAGSLSVMSNAPFGYQYVKRADGAEAYYRVVETEAAVVRDIFRLYTAEGFCLDRIARHLNAQGIATRGGQSRWQRSTLHGMVTNPVYKGLACYGKSELCDRQKITRRARQKGHAWTRSRSQRPRLRTEWIEMPAPAIIEPETFERAQEQLQRNKQLSARHTKEPTLLQGLLVCGKCGYALYRNSGRTAKGVRNYYRCPGRDGSRHLKGAICDNPPVRQEEVDELVWQQVVSLMENPKLVQDEMNRRLQKSLEKNPGAERKETLIHEVTRLKRQIDRLLDGYQEGLIPLAELRQRIPELQKREAALQGEIQSLEARTVDRQRLQEFSAGVESYLMRLRAAVGSLNLTERQKIIRLVVKDIVVTPEAITVNHCIPIVPPSDLKKSPNDPSSLPDSLLRTPSQGAKAQRDKELRETA